MWLPMLHLFDKKYTKNSNIAKNIYGLKTTVLYFKM